MKLLAKIRQNALNFPERVAFESRFGKLTYKDLVNHSEQLATGLVKNNKNKKPVIVYGHMQPEMLVCFLGCVFGGFSYVPIDESVPMNRVQQIIEKSETEFIFSSKDLELPTGRQIQTVLFEDLNEILTSAGVSDHLQSVDGEEIFYTIFTSGSTGVPKGVQISADSLQSFVDWMTNDFEISSGEIFLNQAPFSFDLSVMDVYPALASGGTLYAMDKDLIASMKDLFPFLEAGNLNVWVSTPSFMEICLMNKTFNSQTMPTLKTFLFCGETLPHSTAKELRLRFPDAKIFNTYGPTEATVAVTMIEITDKILEEHEILPIGVCKNDCQILLLNENGQSGEVGEIVIVGPSVANGYLNDPEKSDEVFVQINHERAYRTGDLGTFRDGILFYQGRKDFQIKLHGYRIELEDIEANLRVDPLIENIIVIPILKNGACSELVAVTVVKPHEFEKEYQLTSHLKKQAAERMPNYMIPRKFVYRQSLPMTNNGKIDRKLIASELQS